MTLHSPLTRYGEKTMNCNSPGTPHWPNGKRSQSCNTELLFSELILGPYYNHLTDCASWIITQPLQARFILVDNACNEGLSDEAHISQSTWVRKWATNLVSAANWRSPIFWHTLSRIHLYNKIKTLAQLHIHTKHCIYARHSKNPNLSPPENSRNHTSMHTQLDYKWQLHVPVAFQ